ncbi:hypothetical protein GE061_009811 [Apolygus lucorum]|uniref:Uncharacterized protein n=1 Tax=Apolygus lucorum TaxID=248454 RepID=A0A6A4JYH5_APOLU|nr:hypothetical protein GE061_009811 [Apolygus lucorum]
MAEPQQSTSAVQKGDDLERIGRLQIPRAKLKRSGLSETTEARPTSCSSQQLSSAPPPPVPLTNDLCPRK